MKIAMLSGAVLALTVVSTPAAASGSGSGFGGGFGSGSGASGPTSTRSSQEAQENRLLRRGRSQVRRHITCRDCEYHDRLNAETAAEVAEAVRTGSFDIRDRDRVAVLFYLRDRFGV